MAAGAAGSGNGRWLWASRIAVAIVLLAAWEAGGRFWSEQWISRPTAIVERLSVWLSGDLMLHLGVTLAEIVAGLSIGLPLGITLGMLLGRLPRAAVVFRPFIVTLNSLPIVALAPLLIMWFGLGMTPKIVLVAFVSFLLLFFSAFTGAKAVDEEQMDTLALMGATGAERFSKVVLPSCTSWIMAGVKNALPYSLIGAVIGEMMLSRSGLGHLIKQSAGQFDMTGLYTVLFILMLLGALLNEMANRTEKWLLRWRRTQARD